MPRAIKSPYKCIVGMEEGGTTAVAGGMSEYELKRMERIRENKKMLEELFPDGTGLQVPWVGV